MFKPVRKAVIPAAGLGTRFLPATKATPKEMLPIVDKPTIQYIIEEALASGIEDILIITGRSKRAIEDHFDRSIELELNLEASGKTKELELVRKISNIRIHYIRQKEPRGLGHAILCAKHFVGDEPFAVLLGDDHSGAGGDAHKEAQNQVDHRGRGAAHGAQGVHAHEVAHHQGIHGVVHLLEEGAQGHRQEEKQELLPDDAGEEGVFPGTVRFHGDIPFRNGPVRR